MAWWRGGDTAHSHRKVLRAMAKDPVRGAAVWGTVTLSLSWSTQESQDWWVSESFVRRTFGPAGLTLMRDGQAAGLVLPGRHRRGGENGWLIDDTDPDLLHIRTREEVERDREKSRVTRQVEPTREVRLRDGDQCRYCGKTVSYRDRSSGRAGTYDHPDPADRDVFVVACKACNTWKYGRTVQEWVDAGGLELLPPPDHPLIGAHTAEQFAVPPTDPAAGRAHTDTPSADAATSTARPGTQPDTAAAQSAATGAPSKQDLDLARPRPADLPASGRDGPRSGRVGSGAPRSTDPPPAPSATPSARRTRGRRGRRTPTSPPGEDRYAS